MPSLRFAPFYRAIASPADKRQLCSLLVWLSNAELECECRPLLEVARVADAIPLLAADAPDSLLSGRTVEIGSDGWPPSACSDAIILRCARSDGTF